MLIAATAAGFVAGAMLVAQAWLLSLVVDGVFLRGRTLAEVAALFGWMVAALLVRSVAIYAETVLGQRAASRTKQALRQRLTDHLIRLGPIRLRGERTGELVSMATDGMEALDAYHSQFLPARYLAGLLPLFILLVVIALDAWTSLVLIFAAPMLILMVTLIGGRAKALTERRFHELSWMSAFFLDMLQGLPTLKLFGRSKEQAETIQRISTHYGKTTMEVLATAFQSSLVMEWAATAATALVALEVSYRLMAGQLAFAPALTVLLLTPEFFLPLRTFALRYHAGAAGKAALNRIDALLALPADQRDSTQSRGDAEIRRENADLTQGRRDAEVRRADQTDTEPSAHLRAFAPLRRDDFPLIRFERVSYAYADGERPALAGCTFTILPGTCTALVGASGAGKSTVVDLLLRFIAPQQGRILVGDTPLSTVDAEAWRAQVSWVGQQPHLFQGSVLDNLLLARQSATIEEVTAAAQAADAHGFIVALPEGYATPIGEQGVRLSGGQRQRLAIARAHLKDAPLLILDEATAHLDAASERRVRSALEGLMQGRTVLLVAHHLEMARTADHIVVIDQGAVVESGTHDALLANAGVYRALVGAWEGGR